LWSQYISTFSGQYSYLVFTCVYILQHYVGNSNLGETQNGNFLEWLWQFGLNFKSCPMSTEVLSYHPSILMELGLLSQYSDWAKSLVPGRAESLSLHHCVQTLGPTQLPTKWILGALSLQVKWPGHAGDTLPLHPVPRLRIHEAIPPLSHVLAQGQLYLLPLSSILITGNWRGEEVLFWTANFRI